MSSEETHHKMSKKIAQLTKVIFHLHSKTEEHNQLNTAQTNAYEREIEQLLNTANNVVVKQKEALDKAEAGASWKEKMAALEKSHVDERTKSQSAFQGYQRMIEEKEKKVEADHQSKLAEMRSQFGDLKKGFDTRCQEFKKQLEEFKSNNEAIEALKKAHAAELANHVQNHNSKYNALLTEKLNSEDALRAQMEQMKQALIKEWQTKLQETVKSARNEEISKADQAMSKARADFENKYDILEQQLKKLTRANQELTETVQQRDAVIEDKSQTIGQRDDTILQLEAEIRRLNDLNASAGLEAGDLQKMLASTQQQLADAQALIKKLQEELAQANTQNASLAQECGALKQSIATLKENHTREISEKNLEAIKLKEKITEGENTLKKVKREAADTESRLYNEIAALKKEIKSLQDQIDAMGKDSNAQVKELQARIKQMGVDHEEHCTQMTQEFGVEKEHMNQDFEAQLAALRAQFEQEKVQIMADKDNEREQLRSDMQERIDELLRQLEEEKQNMGAAGKRRENELIGQIEELKKELAIRQTRIESLETTQKELNGTIQEQDQTIVQLQKKIEELESIIKRLEKDLQDASLSGDAAMNDLRKQLQALQQEYNEFKLKAKKDYDQLQKDLTDKHKKETDALIKKYEQMLDDLRRQAGSDKEFVQNELRKKIAELEAKIEEMTKKHAEEKETLLQTQKTMQAKYESQIESLKSEHQNEIFSQKQAFQKEIADKEAQQKEELKNLKSQFKTDMEEAIRKLKEQHQSEIEKLKQEHESHVQNLNAQFDQKMAKTEQQHAQDKQKLLDEHQSEMEAQKKIEDTLRSEIEDLRAKVMQLEAQVASLEHTVQAREQEIEGMRSSVAEAQARMERCVKEHEALAETLKREYAEKEMRMQAGLRRQIEQLVNEQTKEIMDLQEEFANASQLMDQKYKQLNDRFIEVSDLYEGRPSRPEDLELIQQLQDEVLVKEAAIKKAAEDMRFYKLELINREQSYNAMFGAQPQVGLLQANQPRVANNARKPPMAKV